MTRSKNYWGISVCLSVVLLFGCKRATPPVAPVTATEAVVDAPTKEALLAPPVLSDLGPGIKAAAFAKRPTPTGKRFSSLTVEQTGLDFGHNWSPPKGYRLEVYNSLPGGGVCIGDYDDDGWPDIFLTQPNVGSRLYRNLGGLRFQDVSEKIPNAPKALGASFVDIDNDRDLDLYICNNRMPNQLYVNDGEGNFTEQAKAFGLDYNGASVMIAFADYDRDGDLDAYLVTNRVEPETKPTPVEDANGNLQVAEEDLEFIDVVVADRPRVISTGQYDHLYQNNGDGTFTDVSKQANISGNHWGFVCNVVGLRS